MKQILLILFILPISYCIGQTNLSLDIKSDITSLSNEDIGNKFQSLLHRTNYPFAYELSLMKKNEANAKAIDNVKVLSADFIIRVKSLIDDSYLNTLPLVVSASGKSERDILRGMNNKRSTINNFLDQLEQNNPVDCAKLNNAIDMWLKNNQLVQALQLANIDKCGTLELKSKVYDAYQKMNCSKHIANAQAFLAIGKYDEAVIEVIKVSPQSNCNSQLTEVTTKINNDYKDTQSKTFKLYEAYLNGIKNMDYGVLFNFISNGRQLYD